MDKHIMQATDTIDEAVYLLIRLNQPTQAIERFREAAKHAKSRVDVCVDVDGKQYHYEMADFLARLDIHTEAVETPDA